MTGKNTIKILKIALPGIRMDMIFKKDIENTPAGERDFSREWIFSASRSRGPGGQNVNKVNTKVELRFHLFSSQLLTDSEKEMVSGKLKNRMTEDGFLVITSQAERTQLKNKKAAADKFYKLIDKALSVQRERIPTKHTRASKEKRLLEKRNVTSKKALRKKPTDDITA
jgi:ribosome-associated protein